MGNHSMKSKQVRTLPVLDIPGETTTGYAEGLPSGGKLGNVHRIVARHQLKDRIKILENIIRQHQPLVKAMQVTQKVYQEGVMEGIRQVAQAEREKEASLQTKPSQESSEPCANQTEQTLDSQAPIR